MAEEYRELVGDEIPEHLRDAASIGICGRCGRETVDKDMFGQEDRMTQPDGFPCGGRFSDPRTYVYDIYCEFYDRSSSKLRNVTLDEVTTALQAPGLQHVGIFPIVLNR